MEAKHINSALIFLLTLTLIFSVASADEFVITSHVSTAELTPEWSTADTLIEYTVLICNLPGSDPIDEVRIHNNEKYTDFLADNKTGWYKAPYNPVKNHYEFTAESEAYYIEAGECETFTFSAHSPPIEEELCNLEWLFETRDIESSLSSGEWLQITDTTSVDVLPPELTKEIIGSSYGTCPPGMGDECWITQETEIEVYVEDQGRCDPPSGLDYCRITYRVDGGSETLLVEEDLNGEYNWGYTVSFDEDSVHEITIECMDLAGNQLSDTETFKVDSEAPETQKTYSAPHVPGDINSGGEYPHYITSDSQISLCSQDGGDICAVGLEEIRYSVNLAGSNNPCEYESACNPVDAAYEVYEGPFTIPEESCHIIQYYSVDSLGNEEELNVQCVYVDNSPPALGKELDGPQLECDSGEDCDYWVQDHGTNITMTCTDEPLEHPVDDDRLCYRVALDGSCVSNQYCSMFGGSMEGEWCCMQTDEYALVFQEDSRHELEFYCEDSLGNKNPEPDYEVFRVDSQPPIIEKTLEGPTFGTCPPQEASDECWIQDKQCDGGTTIHVSAQDDESLGCASGQVTCSWWYVLDDTWTSPETNVADAFDICFMEDTVHELHIECCDILENCVEDVETFYLDSTPPETEKTYEGPYKVDPMCLAFVEGFCLDEWEGEGYVSYESCVEDLSHRECRQWISLSTQVVMESSDGPCAPCASGVEKIMYSVNIVDDKYCADPEEFCEPLGDVSYTSVAGDTARFTPTEESCHAIQYYAVDNVGNIEKEQIQCVYVDDTAPLRAIEVGDPKIACAADDGEGYCSGTPMLDSCRYYSEDQCSAIDGCEWMVVNGAVITVSDGYCTGMPSSCGATEAWTTDPESACWDADGCRWMEAAETDCWWVQDHVTQVTLSCSDVGVHPVEQESVCYRIGWDNVSNPWLTEEYCAEYGGEVENDWCCAYVGENDYSFDFDEDCVHELEYFCRDHLGNADEVGAVTFKVDSIPPTTSKEYVGPFYMFEGSEWIDSATKVSLTSNDGGATCHVDGVTTYYKYSLVDDVLCADPESYCKPMHECEGWGCLNGLEKEFFTTGRYGQNNPTGAWELAIWDVDPELVVSQDDYVFASGQEVAFSLSYDASDGKISYSVGGKTLSWNAEAGLDIDYVMPFAKGNVNGNYVELTGMTLNGDAIPDLLSGPGYKGLKVPLMADSFSLEGTAKLVWDANPKDEIPGFHVFALSDVWELYDQPFGIDEESCHMIEYYSIDALGNEEIAGYQCAYVDKTPPEVWKAFEGPYYLGEAEWINSETKIRMYAEDVGPHPSGLDTLEYRITLVDDENCLNYSLCSETDGVGDWTAYSDSVDVSISEQSCHMIEIRAKDNVWKIGNHKQCVFVDNAAPEPDKTVGDPKTQWDGKDSIFYPEIGDLCWADGGIDCWKLTLTTPVSLSCVDPDPHPVDHEIVCFNIEVDAEDKTEGYCPTYGGEYNSSSGYCCLGHEIENFYFLEETEHNLKYYCEDALGNVGPVDEEKFKVEGRDFEIQLNKKWNLISVPFMLLNDDIEEVFSGLEDEVESVWTYDAEHQICGQDWCVYTPDGNSGNDNLQRMLPGWGYWVAAKNETTLLIGGSEMMPVVTPPSRMLYSGWNLIGYHGLDGQEGYYGPAGNGQVAYCALYTLRNTMSFDPYATKWSSLITYWEPSNPNQWTGFGILDELDPGAGYWIFMEEDDLYARSTACNLMVLKEG